MADEKIHIWVTGALVAAMTGIYGFLIKHTIGHPNQAALDSKQDKPVCEQIVKRIDDNHKATRESLARIDKKLDRVLEWQENGGRSEH